MKPFLRYIKVFFILQVIFVSFGVVSTLIPNSSVKRNIEQSVEKYEHESIYPHPYINEYGHQLDLFTDYLIISLIYGSSPDKPFKYFLFPQGYFIDIQDQATHHLKYSIANSGEEANFVYGRYWHGSSFFYKLLFVIASLSGVRWLLFMLVSVALFAFYQKLTKTLSPPNAFLFIGGLIFINYYMIFCSMQFVPVFLITFFGSIVLINKHQAKQSLGVLFMILGSLTSYFDLLTAPIITLGIPLLIWVCMLPQVKNIIQTIKQTIIFSLQWSAGYALSWLFKWILIWVFTDYSIIDEVKGKLGERAGVVENLTRFDAIESNFKIINTVPLLVAIFVLVILTALYFNRRGINKAFVMIAVSIVPIIWIFFTANHAEYHSWFTYRNLWVSISGVFLAFSSVIRWEDIQFLRLKKQT